ncbi:MAG: hypothetical protein R3F07_11430 [Opitutaceae bacterium]
MFHHEVDHTFAAAPQPRQWKRFFDGVTMKDGESSWWKGQRLDQVF